MKTADTFDKNTFKDNPFAKECPNCTKNIWEKIKKAKSNSTAKCQNKTEIHIEKYIKD
mgnify:CR=1 FL=1